MRLIAVLMGAAAAVTGLIVLAPGTAAAAKEPLCRRAPALPSVGAEIAANQQQQRYEHGAPLVVPPPVTAPPPSPPPAAAPALERGGASSELAVTGSRVAPGTARPAAPPPPAVASPATRSVAADSIATGSMPVGPQRFRPPAGLLTAGDHDDLLNPLLYARYAAGAARNLGQQVTGLPSVDTRRTLSIVVQDSGGRAWPFVPVTITCADGNNLTLNTVADGRVVLFPALDRLGERVTVSTGGVRRTMLIDPENGGQEQRIVLPGGAAPVRKFDLVIALDTTGSMGDEIAFLKSELQSILGDIRSAYPGLDIRVGLVEYKDLGDEYVTRTLPLTSNFAAVQARLDASGGYGGEDMPEAMDQALIRAVAQDWRPDAVKSMLLVADAPPHDNLQGRAFAAAEAARAKRIQIVPVAASGVDDRAEYFMRAVAAATQSRYIFLTDDSGIGNPHAEPDVDCYVVTQLAGSIRRVLAGQIAGTRVEPRPEEVIRVTGTYDNGRCVLPPDFSI